MASGWESEGCVRIPAQTPPGNLRLWVAKKLQILPALARLL